MIAFNITFASRLQRTIGRLALPLFVSSLTSQVCAAAVDISDHPRHSQPTKLSIDAAQWQQQQQQTQALQQQVQVLQQRLDALENQPKNRGYDVVVETGYSTSPCTNVYPPTGTSVATHDIYLNGTYQSFRESDHNNTQGNNIKLDTDSGMNICSEYGGWAYSRFSYTLTAYPK